MLHPELQKKLEAAGADIEQQPVYWDDADGDRRTSTVTHAHVPGADRQFRFYGPDYDPAPLSVWSQPVGDWHSNPDWTRQFFQTSVNVSVHHGATEDVDRLTNQMMDGLVHGTKFGRLAGYRGVDSGGSHRRELVVSQHWHDGLHTNVTIGNRDQVGPESRLHLSTDLSGYTAADAVPHPVVHQLAREVIEGNSSAVNPLADAIQDHHQLPEKYARAYAAVVGR